MKQALFFLAFIAVACADTSKWLDFRVRFSFLESDAGVNAFFPVGLTLREALNAGWVEVTAQNSLGATTLCLSEKDTRVCPLYDSNGFIAGMLLAIPEEDLIPNDMYDVTRFNVYEKKSINGKSHWTSTYYLVDPKIVAAGGRTSASRTGDGMWIKTGSTFMEVPTDIESIKSKTNFKWQRCVENMGSHFYYNMTTSLDCQDFYPFFMLGREGNMLGIGWQIPGKTQYAERNWYESINGAAVRYAIPYGPECLYNLADNYGVISVHMYFVQRPWTIPCDHSVDSVLPPN